MSEKLWISVYVYFSDLNFLIKKGIYPLLYNHILSELIKKYFFIRYNLKGSHIRLRILCKEKHAIHIKGIINHFFEAFFKTNQSQRLRENPKLRPNNSILFEDYIPETGRYGGKKAITFAEDHFYKCSETVIHKMLETNKWNTGIAQAYAIQLYVVFFDVVNLKVSSLNKMMALMNNNNWKNQAIQLTNNENIEETFSKIFNKNQNAIYSIVKFTQQILNDEEHLRSNKLYDFQKNIIKVDNALSDLSLQKEITFDFKSKYFDDGDEDDIKARIYISYLHMLNNRLGLKNYDEAYMSFILRKILTDKIT